MTRLIDVWRVVDPDARLVGGGPSGLRAQVRQVSRSRANHPRLPIAEPGSLLVVDMQHIGESLDELLATVAAGDVRPAGVCICGGPPLAGVETAGLPALVSGLAAAEVAQRAGRYLADPLTVLHEHELAFRLSAAERALAEPGPSVVAELAAIRLRRGMGVSVDGRLESVVPRVAGRALAARFAAAHARLLGNRSGPDSTTRQAIDGLAVAEFRIRPGASVWLFDDLPLSALDEAVARAAATTLRALLRRPVPLPARQTTTPPRAESGGAVRQTMVAVARANGRMAPAARQLGVHRNTVLYRLRIGQRDFGLDPRRPEDALRLLREDSPSHA